MAYTHDQPVFNTGTIKYTLTAFNVSRAMYRIPYGILLSDEVMARTNSSVHHWRTCRSVYRLLEYVGYCGNGNDIRRMYSARVSGSCKAWWNATSVGLLSPRSFRFRYIYELSSIAMRHVAMVIVHRTRTTQGSVSKSRSSALITSRMTPWRVSRMYAVCLGLK